MSLMQPLALDVDDDAERALHERQTDLMLLDNAFTHGKPPLTLRSAA